jgi:hypothetical protein
MIGFLTKQTQRNQNSVHETKQTKVCVGCPHRRPSPPAPRRTRQREHALPAAPVLYHPPLLLWRLV